MITAAPGGRKLLLIGLDGAGWDVVHPLLDAGRLPTLRALVERGASGTLHTAPPLDATVAWTSLLTGKRPAAHGIHGRFALDAREPQARPAGSIDRTTKALWNVGSPGTELEFAL